MNKKLSIVFLNFSIIFIVACTPSAVMQVTEINNKQEMPRFCLKERLFFYQINGNDEWIQVWYTTNNSLTAQQITYEPVFIYLADKKKHNVKYFICFVEGIKHNSKNKESNLESNPSLSLYQITKKDTLDITNNYNFRISTNLEQKSYSAKINFPSSLLKKIEKPIIGIVSSTPEAIQLKQECNSELQKSTPLRSSNRPQNLYKSQRSTPQKQGALEYILPDINIWFQLLF